MGTLVNCNTDCKHNDDKGYCTLDEISFDMFGGCVDWQGEEVENFGNDVFYIRCKDEETKLDFWKKVKGTKEVIDGIDFFVRGNIYTHGKTGLATFSNEKFRHDEEYKNKIFKILKENEGTCEVSPLYNDDNSKLEIREEGD